MHSVEFDRTEDRIAPTTDNRLPFGLGFSVSEISPDAVKSNCFSQQVHKKSPDPAMMPSLLRPHPTEDRLRLEKRMSEEHDVNLPSALNNGFFFLGLGAVLIGLTKVEDADIHHGSLWLFLIFYVFLRTKMWLDDDHFFRTYPVSASPAEKRLFRLGIVIAILEWSLWAMAGYSLHIPSACYLYLFASLCLSTLWVLVDVLARGATPKAGMWFFVNIIYLALLGIPSLR